MPPISFCSLSLWSSKGFRTLRKLSLKSSTEASRRTSLLLRGSCRHPLTLLRKAFRKSMCTAAQLLPCLLPCAHTTAPAWRAGHHPARATATGMISYECVNRPRNPQTNATPCSAPSCVRAACYAIDRTGGLQPLRTRPRAYPRCAAACRGGGCAKSACPSFVNLRVRLVSMH